VDARRRDVKVLFRYRAYIDEKAPGDTAFVPPWKAVAPGAPVVHIVGAGPAGLFAALRLLEAGVKPVIIEQGKRAVDRRPYTANDTDNFCFGEGGAGTFSDGKLNTRSHKRGNVVKVLQILHYFGAEPSILTDNFPHIGSDKLPGIVTALTDRIIALGGEVNFGCRVAAVHTTGTGGGKRVRVTGLGCVATGGGQEQDIAADKVILAVGHSAAGIYEVLSAIAGTAGVPILEAKPFAVGVRVEHPRAVIDAIQYHRGREDQGTEKLGAARYEVTCQVDGRGVYSFCMCPGGIVVPAVSTDSLLVVNGMSGSARNSRWSNAAIVAEVRPGVDFSGDDPLAGLAYRSAIEGGAVSTGLVAPAQRLTDFLTGTRSVDLPPTSYAPGVVSAPLEELFSAPVAKALKTAFAAFDRKMRGFISTDALLIAPETRTSAPVRILRDDRGESPGIAGLFPAGEGSGYSGGIVSSAMDGEKIAALVAG
jgi:uncharacterized FAD-dependent dehydrogenase